MATIFEATLGTNVPKLEGYENVYDLDAYRLSRVADGSWPMKSEAYIKFWQSMKKQGKKDAKP